MGGIYMLAKYWKKIGMIIVIIACLFNIVIKLVQKIPYREQLTQSAEYVSFTDATITCACGNVIKTKSTKKSMNVDICSNCHPFWTGNLKQNTTGGRADRFKKKYGIK